MKTIKEWFNLLPNSIKELAIKNCISCQGEEFLNTYKTSSLADALYNAFTFSETEQGFSYWDKIAIENSK